MRLVQEWCLAQWIQSTFIPNWVEILRWSSHSETQLTDKSLWTSSWRNGSCRGAVSVSYYTESPLISWVMCVLSPWSNVSLGFQSKEIPRSQFLEGASFYDKAKYEKSRFLGLLLLWRPTETFIQSTALIHCSTCGVAAAPNSWRASPWKIEPSNSSSKWRF